MSASYDKEQKYSSDKGGLDIASVGEAGEPFAFVARNRAQFALQS